MNENFIFVNRTARYFTLGQVSDKTRAIWVVCHGYGQLANFFLKNFTGLKDEETVIIAPEALSRFYLSDTSGRVGASWMTKEDRLYEIEDYVSYLENLLEQILKDSSAEIKIVVFGFSQGVSTVCRWVSRSRFSFQALVLWAGSLPPELSELPGDNQMLRVPIFMATGTNDPYLTPEIILKQASIIETAGLKPELYYFDGKHEISKDLLTKIWQRISNL